MTFRYFLNQFKLYLTVTKNAFVSLNAYKINTISGIVFRVLLFVIQLYIWRALFASQDTVAIGQADEINLQDMAIYAFLSTCISVFVNFLASVTPKIGQKIISGEIATDLIKPIHIKGYLFAEYLGSSVYRFFFDLVPIFLVVQLLFGLILETRPIYFFLFLISSINGCILYFLISYTIGLFSFWYVSVGNLNILVDSMIMLFSGAIIPLWFIPDNLVSIFNFLPFRLLYFSPISIYLGKAGEVTDGVEIILYQFAWIVFFHLLSAWLYGLGTKQLSIQGG